MKRSFWDLLKPNSWGTALIQASEGTSPERTLGIYLHTPDELCLVGKLFREQGEFVFRYADEYDMEPISAFPDTDKVYRSKRLWPFFAVRIPPMDREDMQKQISSGSLEKDQVLEILGSVAKVSVTNPYEFKLDGD
ncbi:MAG: hypothetical protein OXI89_02465 [Gemmatimonadota bacterium]|nr:hypothetical protein [Gemmatimonadota bacterium]